MRQVNIAQRCVNAVAVVRNCAFVAVVDAVRLSSLLLHTRFTGTTSKSIWGNPYEIYSEIGKEGMGWRRTLGLQLQPVMQPVPTPSQSSGSR